MEVARDVRIGIVSLCSRRGQKRENLARITRYGEAAAARGCRLVLFPEFSVNGPWVSYDPEARVEDLVRQAEHIPGPATDHLTQHARRLGIAFSVGIAETGLVDGGCDAARLPRAINHLLPAACCLPQGG
jgi:predicted amidohydrolase